MVMGVHGVMHGVMVLMVMGCLTSGVFPTLTGLDSLTNNVPCLCR